MPHVSGLQGKNIGKIVIQGIAIFLPTNMWCA